MKLPYMDVKLYIQQKTQGDPKQFSRTFSLHSSLFSGVLSHKFQVFQPQWTLTFIFLTRWYNHVLHQVPLPEPVVWKVHPVRMLRQSQDPSYLFSIFKESPSYAFYCPMFDNNCSTYFFQFYNYLCRRSNLWPFTLSWPGVLPSPSEFMYPQNFIQYL